MILIDPPTPFAPKAEWREFLKEMEELLTLHPDSDEVRTNIDEAKEALKEA